MKKLNWLWFFLVTLLFASCEAEVDTELQDLLKSKSEVTISFDQENVETRSGVSGYYYRAPTVKTGDKIGVFSLANGNMSGPKLYTLIKNNGSFTLAEPLEFQDMTSLHTFYFYYPDHPGQTSTDPTMVGARPILNKQVQNGTLFDHLSESDFYVASPVSIVYGDELKINLYDVFTYLEFRINTNINDLIIKEVKFTAPSGKIAAYESGSFDITKRVNATGFREVFNVKGASNEVSLTVKGDIKIPNSETNYIPAYMVLNPLDAYREKITVEIYTDKRPEPYTYELDGGRYFADLAAIINIRIEDEEEPKPELKDIYVLSICDIGFLGTGNNEDVSAPNYGVNCYTDYSKAIRKVLKEHFGPDKTVKTGKIYFDEAGHCGGKLCCKTSCCCLKKNLDYNNMTEAQLDKYNIIFLNRDTRPNEAFAAKIIKWLKKSDDRVLMLSYDWKDSCVKPGSSTSSILSKCYKSTNYILLQDNYFSADIKPHWYNCCIKNVAIGNWGDYRSGILAPFELNERTSYFWKNGPFKTNLNTASDQRYWVRGKYWGSAQVLSPNIIPLVTYRDARYTTSSCCYSKDKGDGGMILGVDPVKRVVYIGDSELFSVDGIKTTEQQNAKMSFGSEMNNYTKIMGNVWAWMIDEVIQKKK